MNMQILSTNVKVNSALINIIKIIKNIKFQYKFSQKETALQLGLSLPMVKNDHIVSYSVNYKLDDYIFEKLDIDIAKLNTKNNLLIIYKSIVNILQLTNGITQAKLSRKLEINNKYDINNWITYLFVKLLNDIKIISYTKKNNKKNKIYLTNDTNIINNVLDVNFESIEQTNIESIE
jgi:transcriptional regulator with XRE-family HTH domain